MAVVPEVPLVKTIAVPSAFNLSLEPSLTLVTVSVSPVNVCPLSTVEAAVPLNKLAADPPSVNVGLEPVAVKVGSSFNAVTVTVDAVARAATLSLEPVLEPLSVRLVSVITRLLVPGSALLFW